MSRIAKAHERIRARYPKVLAALRGPTSAPQYFCELCDREASPDDWSYAALMIVCPLCLEQLAEQGTHA